MHDPGGCVGRQGDGHAPFRQGDVFIRLCRWLGCTASGGAHLLCADVRGRRCGTDSARVRHAWVISNYLVSAINDGEGKFRDIYKGTVYALSPYLIFAVPLTILSRGLTQMETVIYDYSQKGILIWCAFLIFVKVKEIHGYEIGETLKNILLTIGGMLVMGMIAFILFGLSSQVLDFVDAIYQEVKLRVL